MDVTPKDIHVEYAVGIALVALLIARFLVKEGPLHVLAWIVTIGAIVLATTKFSSEVLS